MKYLRSSALALTLITGLSAAAVAQVPGGGNTPAPAGSPVGAPEASGAMPKSKMSPSAMTSPSAMMSPSAMTSPGAMTSPAGSMMKSHMGGAMAPVGGMMMKKSKIKKLTVRMRAQNGSGETGRADLTQLASGVQVVLKINHGPMKVQPAHIHVGSCAKLNPKPAYPLTSVVGGTSTTVIPGLTLAKLVATPYAINVHKSPKAIPTYVSCGNILGTTASTK